MPKEDRNGAHLRTSPRIKIFQPAELIDAAGRGRRVHLLNVSTGGALVYGDASPEVGDEVRLVCGMPLGSARVQWTCGRSFGVSFATPLAAAEIEALVRIQDAVIDATTRRLGLHRAHQTGMQISAF